MKLVKKRKLSRWNRKRKNWHDHNCKKNRSKRAHPQAKEKHIIVTMPTILDIFYKMDESIDFFEKLEKTIKLVVFDKTIFLDAKEVTYVTVETIMYLLALMRNLKARHALRVTFLGNLPENKKARRVMLESGFLDFMSHDGVLINRAGENTKIASGNKTDFEIRNNIINFIKDRTGRINQVVSPVLVELMGNTEYHAYDKDTMASDMKSHWYVYAEDTGEDIKLIYLDTGFGIPSTVNKKVLEHFTIDLLKIGKESKLLQSALEGEARTKTKKGYHGLGLKYIKEKAMSGELNNMMIISNKAKCTIVKSVEKYDDAKKSLKGTFFSWTISKEKRK